MCSLAGFTSAFVNVRACGLVGEGPLVVEVAAGLEVVQAGERRHYVVAQ